ncbi:unnamed protein product [Lota lota]
MDASVCTYSRDIQSREEEVEDVQEEIRRRGSPPGGLREEQTSTSSGDESPCPSQNLFNNGHRRSDSLVSNWPDDGSSRSNGRSPPFTTRHRAVQDGSGGRTFQISGAGGGRSSARPRAAPKCQPDVMDGEEGALTEKQKGRLTGKEISLPDAEHAPPSLNTARRRLNGD